MKPILHIIIVSFLTLFTQIGGILWILNFGIFRLFKKRKSIALRLTAFSVFYLLATVIVVPPLAKLGGRTQLPRTKSGTLIPHNILTPMLNRNYVKPELRNQLEEISQAIHLENPNLKLSYLDANFPFINGFPLLPHLSHNDGKKVDLSFYYTLDLVEGNQKPSNSGYGKFVEPINDEIHQTEICKTQGNWQYDFTKYFTFGGRDDLEFDLANTRNLIRRLVEKPNANKLFIEPHLKTRMKLNHAKIRFHGCQAVRHDDHIHYQIN